jgi:hypothetical protein
MQSSSATLRKKCRPRLGRLNQGYISLLLTPKHTDGSCTVSLARYGAYEVQLVELAHDADDGGSSLWLRLYDRDSRSSLDDRRCDDLEHAESLVEHLLSRAMQLHSIHV